MAAAGSSLQNASPNGPMIPQSRGPKRTGVRRDLQSQNAMFPTNSSFLGSLTVSSRVQRVKQPRGMTFRRFGSLTDLRPQQPLKAFAPICSTESGISTRSSQSQPLKHAGGIAFNPFGSRTSEIRRY